MNMSIRLNGDRVTIFVCPERMESMMATVIHISDPANINWYLSNEIGKKNPKHSTDLLTYTRKAFATAIDESGRD